MKKSNRNVTKLWKGINIRDWNDFENHIHQLERRDWLFRGQADASWKLSTSIDRLFNDLQPIIENAKNKPRTFAKKEHERLLVRAFQKNANLYFQFPLDRKRTLEWLAIMQHYGTPTRLLDVTLSPYIAMHFALEMGSQECCVYAINHAEIKRRNKETYEYKTYKHLNDTFFVNEPKPEDPTDNLFSDALDDKRFITMLNPQFGNERWVAQQGLFLVPSQIDISFEDLLLDYDLASQSDIGKKFIIPPSLRYEAIERLRQMNITSASLFPGIDGFCKSLKFQVLETTKNQKILE